MGLIYNGILCNTIEELEIAMTSISEDQKNLIRNDFNGISNDNTLTQKEKDYAKYLKRAAARNKILAEMASENVERIRNGVWTTAQLVLLTQDVELKNVLDDINTLSFELAVMKLQYATNIMLTSEIKNAWIAKLVSNFHNE